MPKLYWLHAVLTITLNYEYPVIPKNAKFWSLLPAAPMNLYSEPDYPKDRAQPCCSCDMDTSFRVKEIGMRTTALMLLKV